MNFDETNIGSTLMMFSGILGIALGGYDALGRTLIYLVALDYITGVYYWIRKYAKNIIDNFLCFKREHKYN